MPDFRKHAPLASSLLAWWAGHPWRVACTRCAWGLAVAVVVRQSLIPQPDMLLDVPQIDKVWHALAYLLLALLAAESFRGRQLPPSPPVLAPAARRAAWSMALLGVGLEFAQAYVPGRVASAADMAANATGTWLGVLLAGHLLRRMAALAETRVSPTDRGAPDRGRSACPASPVSLACSASGQRRRKQDA